MKNLPDIKIKKLIKFKNPGWDNGSLLRSFTSVHDGVRYWKLYELVSYMLNAPLSLHITSKTWYVSKLSVTRFHAIHELNLCIFKQVIASLSYFYLETALKFPSKCFWSAFFSPLLSAWCNDTRTSCCACRNWCRYELTLMDVIYKDLQFLTWHLVAKNQAFLAILSLHSCHFNWPKEPR